MNNAYKNGCSSCATCPFNNTNRICRVQDKEHGRHPETCATVYEAEVLKDAFEQYMNDPELKNFALNACRQEGACYEQIPYLPGSTRPIKPRIMEVAEFCQRMGYKKIGLAFCGGLQKEALKLTKILKAYGLEVVSVMCKVGGISKEKIGISECEKILPGRYENMCNPIGQAAILNEAETEFNLLLGLCVGHDSMFLRFSKAMCTVVAVKDRPLGNNPLAAIYSDYYRFLLKGDGQHLD